MSTYSDTAKNNMLGSEGSTHASLHTAYSTTGANEVTGGSYARIALTWAAASAGARSISNSPAFSVPAGNTIRWVGRYDALSAGNFLGMTPNGATKALPCRGQASDDVVTCEAHGFSDTDKVVFVGASVPTGLTAGTVYFVRDATTDTFKVAATSGGAAIDLTADGNAIAFDIVEDTYGSAGTHTVTSLTININLIT